MESTNSSNPFIFNQKFDTTQLLTLYENDFVYIEEVFKTVLEHFDSDLAAIQARYNENNLIELRKSVHKIKPAFGFIGIPDIQEFCLQFEQSCNTASGVEELGERLKKLMDTLNECKTVIQQEYEKLVLYNKAQP